MKIFHVQQIIADEAHNPIKISGKSWFFFIMDEFLVYILYSRKFDRTYVGFTTDLINRFHSHNHFSKKGYTVKFRPWEVVHVEFFKTKQEALSRELWLKSGVGREWLHAHVLGK